MHTYGKTSARAPGLAVRLERTEQSGIASGSPSWWCAAEIRTTKSTLDSVSSLNVFVQVVDGGSFVAAARVLGISASAVGKSVTRLEERASARLFHRTSRSLRLTPEGQRFAVRCRRILAEIHEAEAELAASKMAPAGLLRVTLPLVGGPFHAALADFHETHPAIDLELDYTNRSVDLVREGFDAAIRWGPLRDSTLKTRSLGSFRCVLVGSPAYLAQRGAPRRVRDLRDHDLLQLRLSNSGRRQPLAYRGASDERAEPARTPVVVNRVEALVDFAVRGRGLAYVAEVLIDDELDRGVLVPVLDEQIGHFTPAHLMWAPGKHVPPKLRVFIDWMAKRFEGAVAPARQK